MDQTSEPANPLSQTTTPLSTATGCVNTTLLVLLPGWLLAITAITLLVTWVVEQSWFDSPFSTSDYRWLISASYALGVLLPGILLWLLGRALSGWRFFRALALAGLFVLCLVPARLAGLTAALLTNLLQIAGMLVFLLILWFEARRYRAFPNFRGLGPALLLAGMLGYPWVVLGALGSLWDILLNLFAALLFGLAASQVTQVVFTRDEERTDTFVDILIHGLFAALVLLIMAVGLGVNGNQGLLVIAVPVLGWALAALSDRSRRADGHFTSNTHSLALLVGLAAFWPMAFIDPDELAVVIALGFGELIQWANLAALAGLVIGTASVAVVLILRALQNRLANFPRQPVQALTMLVWLAALGLYLGPGQPGLFGDRLFVILKDQADLSQVAGITDTNQRRAAVYQALVHKADTTQANFRQQLERFHIPYQPYYLENAIEVQAGPLVRWWFESQPEVDRVLDSPILRPLPAPVPPGTGNGSLPTTTPWNLKMIGADRVWSELGVTGKGIIVGQSDSGVQGNHPELADSYRGRNGQNDYNWFDPWNHTTVPTDIGGHGTHTLGTILGDQVGVAPDAEWIGCVNLARNLGNPAVYLDCMQFMLAPFPQNGDPLRDGLPERGAMVLNNSWGCPPVEGCDPNALLPAVIALRAAGVFVVASAGNDGNRGCGTIVAPLSLYAQVYSVAALDSAGDLASFSSLGPVEADGSQRVKPNIAAPGQDVVSSFPGSTYAAASGTSMAGPHLVGVVALMWSANPALIGDIDRTIQILDETAADYTGPLPACVSPGRPNNAAGYGIVDAYAAVRRALEQ